ncbi:hypothetical protein KBC75_03490 [Candidatus Shapirobacteria bacterium]|nr:hypothetical protein [Candidatus Shapirobacteria bacterium]
MNQRLIITITLTVLIAQLIFSFYYSSLSVSLNQKYQSISLEYQILRNLNDQLKTQMAIATSLSKLASESASLKPIDQVIDLSQP